MGGGAFGPFGEQKFTSWKYCIYFCINAAEKHSERPCYGIWLKFVDFWPAWRTNLLNVPLVYAHGRILHTQSAPSHRIHGSMLVYGSGSGWLTQRRNCMAEAEAFRIKTYCILLCRHFSFQRVRSRQRETRRNVYQASDWGAFDFLDQLTDIKYITNKQSLHHHLLYVDNDK